MRTLEEIISEEKRRSKLHPIIHAEIVFIEQLDYWEKQCLPNEVHISYFRSHVNDFCRFSEQVLPVERIHFINSFSEMKKECEKRGYSKEAMDYLDLRIKEQKAEWNL